jgi:hypothetical protein
VRGPWKTDPHGTAGPGRLCCIAVSAGGGFGVVQAALGCASAPGGPCVCGVCVGLGWGASRLSSFGGVGEGEAVAGALQGWGHCGSRGGTGLGRCRLAGAQGRSAGRGAPAMPRCGYVISPA